MLFFFWFDNFLDDMEEIEVCLRLFLGELKIWKKSSEIYWPLPLAGPAEGPKIWEGQ